MLKKKSVLKMKQITETGSVVMALVIVCAFAVGSIMFGKEELGSSVGIVLFLLVLFFAIQK